jgi:PAS domain S-box-containing protein
MKKGPAHRSSSRRSPRANPADLAGLTSRRSASGREHAQISASPAGREAKKLLAAAAHPLATLVKTFNEFLFELDAEGKFLHLWSSNEALLHGRRTEFLGRHALDVLGEDIFRPFSRIFQHVITTGESEDIEFPAGLADGEHWFQARVSAVARAGEKPHSVCLLVRDITERKRTQEKLQKSEALLAQAEQLAGMGSWELDAGLKLAVWSDNLYRLLGVDPREIPISLERVWPAMRPDDVATSRKHLDDAFTHGKPFEHDVRYTMPDGRERILHARGVPIRDAEGRVVRVAGVTHDITDRQQAEQGFRRVSQRLLTVRDEEQRRIAHDLHETAAQSMAALKMTLGRLGQTVPKKDKHSRKLLRTSRVLANEVVQEIRTVSYLLHPLLLEEAGLGPALRWFASGFEERSGIRVKVKVAAELGRLPSDSETAIFRVIQEALTNVHRHSKSRTAMIRLGRANGRIRVEVKDQGVGMALPSAATGWNSPLGIGIAGMRERVKQLFGAFEIQSKPGHGTTIRVELPVGAEQSAVHS